MDEATLLSRMALALAIGLAVGTERGWQKRGAPEGARVAGIRTFTILGLLGGLVGTLVPILGGIGVGLTFLALIALLATANIGRFLNTDDHDITTEIAALATLVLGVAAVQGDMILAAVSATVMVALLDMKPRLHEALTRIEPMELKAAIQLALLSVVVLPLLPDRGFGPGGVINPYAIWWFVVIVAAISFAGYAAVKIAGQSVGLLITGFFAGLVSSTALTVSLSRRARETDIPHPTLAAGVAVGTGTMFVRLLILVSVARPTLGLVLAPSLVAIALAAYAAALVLNRKVVAVSGQPTATQNPLDLTTALLFGLLLTLIAVLAYYAKTYAGNAGIYTLATVGGLADVDAISLSLAHAKDIALPAAATGVLIAAYVNTATKIGLAAVFGTPRFGLMIAAALLPALFIGGILMTSLG